MLRALRHRNFRWFWLSGTAQSMAIGMQFLILGWLVLDETDNSSAQLGLVIFLFGLPNLSLSLVGGLIADRIDRRKFVIVTYFATTALILVLGIVKTRDLVEIWHLYSVAIILGTLQSLSNPARMAMVTDLVPREDIMSAVAVNSGVMNSGRMLGPALAGGIIELRGINVALYFNAGCYFLAPLCFLMIRGLTQQKATGKGAVVREFQALVDHFRSTPVAFMVITAGFTIGIFVMPVTQAMPAFAKDVLGTGAGGAGLLLTGMGLGSTIGSFALASLGNIRWKNRALVGGGLGVGVFLLLFALSPWYWVSWVLMLLAGISVSAYATVGTSVLQLTSPREVLGRVLGVWTLGGSLVFVGALPMGVVADATNWPTALGWGAVIFLVLFFWLAVWKPTFRWMGESVA